MKVYVLHAYGWMEAIYSTKEKAIKEARRLSEFEGYPAEEWFEICRIEEVTVK